MGGCGAKPLRRPRVHASDIDLPDRWGSARAPPADRQEPWRAGVLTHRTVGGIDVAAVVLECIEQKYVVNVVAGEAEEKTHLFRQDSRLDTSANYRITAGV